MIAELIRANRSCRRFDEQHRIQIETLTALVDLARMSASAANLQPLKYVLSCHPDTNTQIFDCLKWAGYLKLWDGPDAGERPGGYIVILNDTRISRKVDCDHGIASQSILLGAREIGLAGCILAAVNRPKLSSALDIPAYLDILLVLAIGKPIEQAVIDPVDPQGDIRYWRDDDRIHHVPKRALQEIIIKPYSG
jgi:nitroreductase